MLTKAATKLIAAIFRLPDDTTTTMTYGQYRDSDLVLWHKAMVMGLNSSFRFYFLTIVQRSFRE